MIKEEIGEEVAEKAVDLVGRGVAALIGVAGGVAATLGVQKLLKLKKDQEPAPKLEAPESEEDK